MKIDIDINTAEAIAVKYLKTTRKELLEPCKIPMYSSNPEVEEYMTNFVDRAFKVVIAMCSVGGKYKDVDLKEVQKVYEEGFVHTGEW